MQRNAHRNRFAALVLAASAVACGDPTTRSAADASQAPAVIPAPEQGFVQAGGLAAETAPDASTRAKVLLTGESAGTWRFRFDDDDVGLGIGWFDEATPDSEWTEIDAPAAWDLAHPDGFDRQTVGWYRHEFTPPSSALGENVRLRFDGIFREARVWLNGVELGGTDLPYLPFAFDVTDTLRADEENRLVVRIDNRITQTTLPCDTRMHAGKHGWFPYGGVLRPVWLEGGLATRTAQVMVRTDLDGAVDAKIFFAAGDDPGDGAVLDAEINFAGETVARWQAVAIPSGAQGLALRTTVASPRLWSAEHPEHAYALLLTVSVPGAPAEATSYDFAFRRLEARDTRFVFNDEDFYLYGINRHEDHPTLGPVYDETAIDLDMALIDELGANFSRPGHYPNDVRTLRAFEAQGVLLAEEIPVYQWERDQMADAQMVKRAVRALDTLIIRDYNRPGIGMWSVANEIHTWVDSAPEFVQTLYDTAKRWDPDRPVMIASVGVPGIVDNDQASGRVDVIGINEYEGWYTGSLDSVPDVLEGMRRVFPESTLFVSEYGAGALQGRHAEGAVGEESRTDHSYTEEYQSHFHERHIAQFRDSDFVRGFMPWVFADFRMQWSPTTGNPHPADKMNLKGLVSFEREPKAAFRTLADEFAKAP